MGFRLLIFFLTFFLSLSMVFAKKTPGHKKHPGKHRASHVAPRTNGLLLEQKLILTFDDGPELTLTPQVLDLLDEHGVKAIFFVNGYRFRAQNPQAEKAKELLREIVRRGHFVGNHTVNHPYLCGKKGPEIAETEIVENARLIEEAIRTPPYFFRTPYGSHCPHLSALLKKLGIDPIGWNVDPQDWKLRDRYLDLAAIQNGLSRLPKMQKPVVILMHDVHKETVEMLPLLFDWLKTKPNFTIVHPIELVSKPKVIEELKQLIQPIQKMFHFLNKVGPPR